jgi:hypothetical protein
MWVHTYPLLSNDSVNTFQRIRNKRGHPLLGNGCVFCAVVRPEAIKQEAKNNWHFSWKFQWSAQSEEDDSVSDSDLWTVVPSCTKGPINSITNPKPALFVMETPDMWRNVTLMKASEYEEEKRKHWNTSFGSCLRCWSVPSHKPTWTWSRTRRIDNPNVFKVQPSNVARNRFCQRNLCFLPLPPSIELSSLNT